MRNVDDFDVAVQTTSPAY